MKPEQYDIIKDKHYYKTMGVITAGILLYVWHMICKKNSKYKCMMESLMYYLTFIIFAIVNIPILVSALIFYPFGLYIPSLISKITYFLFDLVFLRSLIIYTHDIDKKQNYVQMLNHQGFIDGNLGFLLQKIPTVLATGYVKNIPVVGQIGRLFNFTFIEKDKSNSVEIVVNKLKDNPKLALALFPEGERLFDHKFHPEKVRSGGFVIAKQAGCSILPIYQTYGNILQDDVRKYRFDGRSFIIFGKPITTENKEVAQLVQEYCQEMLKLETMSKNLEKQYKLLY